MAAAASGASASGSVTPLSILVVGASGDLAKKKTYPSLFSLYSLRLLPATFKVYGYARSAKTDVDFRATIADFLTPMKGSSMDFEAAKAEFLDRCVYRRGGYDSSEDMGKVMEEMAGDEGDAGNRLFYFAIPPTVFAPVSRTIKATPGALTSADRGWCRVVIEKPFGNDSASSAELGAQIAECFEEEQIYRIDHYLGKEMVQNLMALRFGNRIFEPLWNAEHIKSVQISFKEPFGTKGRGGYFDKFGIIRDVLQNHLLQVLSLVAMEAPVSLDAEDIRDEKVKVLRCMPPIKLEETVLGQYGTDAEGKEQAYLDDPTVPEGSVCPTFATCVLHINNARWWGVPFVLRAGKALNERKAEIRIQFREKPNALYPGMAHNNELVLRIQPDEAVWLKVMAKTPGMASSISSTELDLSYKSRYTDAVLPDAYARLILDALRGDRSHFVRSDELAAAWSIFTPLLHTIEGEKIKPIPYVYGSRGPAESDALIAKAGYSYRAGYSREWHAADDEAKAGAAAAAAKAAAEAAAKAAEDTIVFRGIVTKRAVSALHIKNWHRRCLELHDNPPRLLYTKEGDEEAGDKKEFKLDASSHCEAAEGVKPHCVRVAGVDGELLFVPADGNSGAWIEKIQGVLAAPKK